MIKTDIGNFALLVALALLFSRLIGYIFEQAKQPPVIGEIIAGVILGALGLIVFTGQSIFLLPNYMIELPDLSYTSNEFSELANLGILFLLFISGLSTHFESLIKFGKPSIAVAIGGIIAPFILGVGTGYFFGFHATENLILGLILVATSVGVTVRTLMDLGQLNSCIGNVILGAAVIDDVLGVLLLAFALGVSSPFAIGIKILLFFFIFLYVGLRIIDKILDFGERIHLPKAFLSFTIAIFLFYVYFAEQLEIAGIIGAFVAGVLVGKSFRSRRLIEDIETIGYGFFIPLFFVWVGASLITNLYVNPDSFSGVFLFSLVMIVAAVVGKIVGCGTGACLSGFTMKEGLQIGVGMIPRMELALIITTSAIAERVLSPHVGGQFLAVTVIITVVTTLLTPILIKYTFKGECRNPPKKLNSVTPEG